MTQTTKVDTFIEQWDLPKKVEVEALRAIILGADPSIKEEIKWNAPSFFVNDHFATIKSRPYETIQIVLHTGAKVKANPMAISIKDPSKILKWVAKDRCLATFADMADLQTKEAAFESVVRQWVTQL